MPLFDVELSDGRIVTVESQNEPTEQQVLSSLNMPQQQLGTKATPDQFLSFGQRLGTGFKVNPEQAIEEEVAKRGLAPGTPLEPTPQTASLTENILDLPSDIADWLGPSIPIVAQGIASALTFATTKNPGLTVAAGGGAAGTAEAARQFIGDVFLDPQDVDVEERAKRIALETGLGAVSEVGGFALAGALKSSKNAIAKGMEMARKRVLNQYEKIAKRKGIDKAAIALAQVTRNLRPQETLTLLREQRKGVLDPLATKFASTSFPFKFLDKVLFGVGKGADQINNLAKNIRKIGSKSKAAAIRLGKEIGLDENAINQIIRKGAGLSKIQKKGFFKKTADNVLKETRKIRDEAGKELNEARVGFEEFLSKAGKGLGKERTLDVWNTPLVDLAGNPTKEGTILEHLVRRGFLKKVELGKETFYKFTPTKEIIGTTGKKQNETIRSLVNNFMGKKEVPLPNDAAVNKITRQIDKITDALQSGKISGSKATKSIEKIKSLQKQLKKVRESSAKETTLYSPDLEVSTAQVVKDTNTLQSQLSKKAFEDIAGESPVLTQIKRALDSKVASIANDAGFENVVRATKEFSDIQSSFNYFNKILKGVDETNSLQSMENVLRGLAKGTSETTESAFQTLQKKMGRNVLDDIKAYDAAMQLEQLDQITAKERLTSLMKGAFDDPGAISSMSIIDDGLAPENSLLRNGKIHIASSKLNNNIASFFRSQFIGKPLVGGVLGSTLGPIGGVAGFGAGLAAQSPAFTKQMIRQAAKVPSKIRTPKFLNREIVSKGLTTEQQNRLRQGLAILARNRQGERE